MATSQYDVAHSFCSLSRGFGPLGLVPRRVEGPSRHGGGPIRRGALVLLPFGRIRTLGARATSYWRPIATWRTSNATWRARFTLFWGVSAPLSSSHVALEAHRDMTRSFYPLFEGFGPLELEPRRVGGPSRHGGLPMRHGALILLSFGGDSDPRGSSHVALEAHRDMAHSQYDVARSFCSLSRGFGPSGLEPRRVGGPSRHGALPIRRGAPFSRHFNKKSHLRTKSEVAGLVLIILFLVCLTCQLDR